MALKPSAADFLEYAIDFVVFQRRGLGKMSYNQVTFANQFHFAGWRFDLNATVAVGHFQRFSRPQTGRLAGLALV
jgi:hypothetical protein